jgi:hypothetical protein
MTEAIATDSKPPVYARGKTPTGKHNDATPTQIVGARKRREAILKLQARLEREINRDNEITRKERNSQLFVWGAMVESVYRNGDERQRILIQEWAAKHLTEERHRHRAKLGFERIEDEKAKGSDE